MAGEGQGKATLPSNGFGITNIVIQGDLDTTLLRRSVEIAHFVTKVIVHTILRAAHGEARRREYDQIRQGRDLRTRHRNLLPPGPGV